MTVERDRKYDTLRGLAILFVLLVHISADYVYTDSSGVTYAILKILNNIFNIAVPTFVTLTVFLGLRSGRRHGASYMLKKTLPLLALYLVWSLVYIFFYSVVQGFSLPKAEVIFTDWLLQGRTYYHLYYIIMLVQLYAVITLLSRKKAVFEPRSWLPLAGAGVQISVLGVFTQLVINPFKFYNTAILVIFYITSITFGLCLAADSEKTERDFRKYWWIYAAVLIAAVLVRVLLCPRLSDSKDLKAVTHELIIFGGIPLMFILAELFKSRSPLALLGRHSLGIYFAHPLLLTVIDDSFKFTSSGTPMIMTGMAVKLAAALAFSFAFSLVMERIKSN